MSKIFQAPSYVDGVSPLKDGGLSVRFHTQELTNEEKLTILNFYQSFGYLLFKENQFSEEEIPKEDAPEEGKSQSQRLRGVIYLVWKQQNKEPDFEKFYRRQTEGLIQQYKERLDK